MKYQSQNENAIQLKNDLWPHLLSISNTNYEEMMPFLEIFQNF